MDLNQFITWQAEKPSRVVDIRICKAETRVWVWDNDLGVGQFASSVDAIDLEARKQRRIDEAEKLERQKYESLRKKYEGAQT